MNAWEITIFFFHVVAEVSQSKSNKAKNSWVSNVNKEVFVQPELHGIVEHKEEEELKSSSR